MMNSRSVLIHREPKAAAIKFPLLFIIHEFRAIFSFLKHGIYALFASHY